MIYTNEETKKRFEVLARIVLKKFLAVNEPISDFNIVQKKEAIIALYDRIQKNTKEADLSALMKELQDIVDASVNHIVADDGDLEKPFSEGNVITPTIV